MWFDYYDKDNHNQNKADCRAIAKFKYQKKARYEAKSGPGKKLMHSKGS
jgi:hypothetical protein